MCLAIPGQIVAIEGRNARVEFGGITREIALDLVPEAGAGSWVLAHAGFAIQLLTEEEARETLSLFDELREAGMDEVP